VFSVTTIKKYRLQANLTQKELARRCGIATQTLVKYERPNCNGIRRIYLRIREVLEIPMDELLNECPESNSPRCLYRSRTENHSNPITTYRHVKRLTYNLLAPLIGATTKEAARKACARKTPVEAHIERLAAFEGVTPAEFITTYSPIFKEEHYESQ